LLIGSMARHSATPATKAKRTCRRGVCEQARCQGCCVRWNPLTHSSSPAKPVENPQTKGFAPKHQGRPPQPACTAATLPRPAAAAGSIAP
jgi:hypothetical protein